MSVAKDRKTVLAIHKTAILKSIYGHPSWFYQVVTSRSSKASAIGDLMKTPLEAWRSAARSIEEKF